MSEKITFTLDIKTSKSKAELDSLRKKLQDYSDSIDNVNTKTTNLGTSTGLTAKAFAVWNNAIRVGLDLAKKLAVQIYEVNKQYTAMEFALKAVTSGEEDYQNSLTFTRGLVAKYGGDLISITKQYTKFRAATKTSNLTLSQTNSIYEDIHKSAAILHLDNQSLERSFKALEQMISKGKVSSEELRQQLGDHLPGAYAILAESMGITTAELDKQLKAGTVMADEVLPEFAKELLKTYGGDTVKSIENLNTESTKFINIWKDFLADPGVSSAITESFKSMRGFLIAQTRGDEFGSVSYSDWLFSSSAELDAKYRQIATNFDNAQAKKADSLKKHLEEIDSAVKSFVDGKSIEELESILLTDNYKAKSSEFKSAYIKHLVALKVEAKKHADEVAAYNKKAGEDAVKDILSFFKSQAKLDRSITKASIKEQKDAITRMLGFGNLEEAKRLADEVLAELSGNVYDTSGITISEGDTLSGSLTKLRGLGLEPDQQALAIQAFTDFFTTKNALTKQYAQEEADIRKRGLDQIAKDQKQAEKDELARQKELQAKKEDILQAGVITAYMLSDALNGLGDTSDARNKEEFEKAKKFQKASILMSTGAAIVGALGMQPWSFANLATAAAMAITGGIEWSKVNKLTYDGGSSSAPTKTIRSSYTSARPGFNDVDISRQQQITESNSRVMKAYVVSSEVEGKIKADNAIKDSVSI
jgi:tape measure domain-containing protein